MFLFLDLLTGLVMLRISVALNLLKMLLMQSPQCEGGVQDYPSAGALTQLDCEKIVLFILQNHSFTYLILLNNLVCVIYSLLYSAR